MRSISDTEHPDELVLAAVERALACIRLYPDCEVERVRIDGAAGFEQFADVAPIHADEMNGAVTGHRRGRRQRALQEVDETSARQFAGCHSEFGMLDLAATDDVADAHIIGRIQESHRGASVAHQTSQVVRVARIAAQETVTAQFPEVARLAHWRGGARVGINGVSWI